MCLTEYNESETMQMFKEEGREEGIKEGIKEGRDALANAIQDLRNGVSMYEMEKKYTYETIELAQKIG